MTDDLTALQTTARTVLAAVEATVGGAAIALATHELLRGGPVYSGVELSVVVVVLLLGAAALKGADETWPHQPEPGADAVVASDPAVQISN
jgi:hypothetical protein